MYRRTAKLSFKSFMSALLALLLLAVTISAQTTSPTYPRWPDLKRQNPAIINAQEFGPKGNANAQRPSIKDMMLGEEPPSPREDLKRGNDKFKTTAQQKLNPDRTGVSTIPHWSDTYTYQGLAYNYTMVGTDPKKESATTTIPAVIIPLRFIFEVGTPVEGWCDPPVPVEGPPVPGEVPPPPPVENCYTRIDEVERRIALEPGNVETIINSPIFKSHPFTVGGVDVGNTQYGDAFQRANFWGSVSDGSQDYHVLLGQPTVMPTIDVFVPRDPSLAALFGGIPNVSEVFASIRADFVREAIEKAIRQNGVSTQTLPIVLYSDRIALSDPWYFMKGYVQRAVWEKGFNDAFEVPGGLQTFIASPFFTWPVAPSDPIDYGNVGAFLFSSLVLNWLNNPFNQNYTPGYDGRNNQCGSDVYYDKLRAGDAVGELPLPPPIPGATPDPITNITPRSYYYTGNIAGYPIDTEFGRYSLANGSFIDAYSRQTPTQSPGGRYNFFDQGTFHLDPDNPDESNLISGPDVPALAPAPPCVGHVEVEKQALEYPNAVWTRAYGINNGGTIVGDFKDQSNFRHGFIFDGRNYTQIDYPGARFTVPIAINDQGEIVGGYWDADGVPHGFLWRTGSFSPIDFPGAADTIAESISNHGDIVGTYGATQPIAHGFILQGGQYRTIDSPFIDFLVSIGVPPTDIPQTDITGINDSGQMVGFSWVYEWYSPINPFTQDQSSFTQPPEQVCFCQTDVTYPSTINDQGQFGGYHGDPMHIYNNDGRFGYATIYGYPHTIYSNGVFGMNGHGKIVGNYFDEDQWRTVGYVATLPH